MDFSLQRDDMFRRMRRLICFDMDSTLIQTECIDELAERNGVGAEVRAITESAMRGEIDFKESFTRRVALLKGLDVSVMQDIAENLPITEGADRLMSVLKTYGYKIAILSGGFTFFGEYLRQRFGVDYVYANELEIGEDGKLTGRYLGEIVDGRRKADLLKLIAQTERPPDARGGGSRHRFPRETARRRQRPPVHQHHRPGRRPVLPGLQGQQPRRTREDVVLCDLNF